MQKVAINTDEAGGGVAKLAGGAVVGAGQTGAVAEVVALVTG